VATFATEGTRALLHSGRLGRLDVDGGPFGGVRSLAGVMCGHCVGGNLNYIRAIRNQAEESGQAQPNCVI
jgi:hypothetical protein